MTTFHENLVQSFHNFRDKYLKANGKYFKFGYETTKQKYGYVIDDTFHEFSETTNPRYLECSTARSTAAKVVTATNFTLDVGTIIAVRFTNTGTSNPSSGNLTLNVGNTGAKTIVDGHANKTAVTYSSGALFCNNIVNEFVYDGTYWVWLNRDNNTTYNGGSLYTSASKTGSGTTVTNTIASGTSMNNAIGTLLNNDVALNTLLSGKASTSDINNINTQLSGKASTSDVTFGNQIIADISVSTGAEVGKYIREHVDSSKLQKGYVFNLIPAQSPQWFSGIIYCDNSTWTTGTTCWGFYMNRDNSTLYKYNYTYGGADSVTPLIAPSFVNTTSGNGAKIEVVAGERLNGNDGAWINILVSSTFGFSLGTTWSSGRIYVRRLINGNWDGWALIRE